MTSDSTYRDPNSAAWINPYDYPTAWDVIILDGYVSPGLCTECAGSNPRKWDKRDGTGQSGATVVYNGDGLAQFPAKIQLGWRRPGGPTPQEQFAAWDAFKQLLRSPQKKGEGAMTIFHPNLALLPTPVDTVTVEDVIGPKAVQPGIWEWEIKFLQYRAPKPAGTSPSGAKSKNASSNGSNSTGDAADALISSLADELGSLT